MNLAILPYSFDIICGKKLSEGILLWVMTKQIPSLAALSAISFPFIPTIMTRNPAQADMLAHISQLGVKLKYVEDCNTDNIKALNFL